MRVRQLAGTLLVAALVVAACGGESIELRDVAASSRETDVVRAGSTQWDSVSVAGDERTLRVAFVGGAKGPLSEPCNADYEVGVDETDEEVVVTVCRLALAGPIEETDYACFAIGYGWEIDVTLTDPLGSRSIVDGHDESIDEAPLPDGVAPELHMYAEERGITHEQAEAELNTQAALANWAGSVRFEPWYDGFRFEHDDEGIYGVIALDVAADPPELPADLPLRSVVSRMGQREWRSLVPTLADEMEAIDVIGVSYDPFADTVTVTRREGVPAEANAAEVADGVRSLLGDGFSDVEIVFDTGTGTSFEAPPTTR